MGAALSGKRVVIVDDVITAGTAIRESMQLLTSVQAEVVGVALALDRQERGTDSPLSAVQSVEQQYGVQVLSVVGLRELLDFFMEKAENGKAGDGEKEALEAIREYRAQYGVVPLQA